MTTQQKCDAVNAWTVVGQIPTSMLVTADAVFNCIAWSEFAVLTAAQQQNVLLMCAVPGQLLGGSANVAHMLPGMLVAYFPVAGVTIANLTALARARCGCGGVYRQPRRAAVSTGRSVWLTRKQRGSADGQ